MLPKQEKKQRRHRRIRARISGTFKVPRLCVFRSAKHIYAQLIDDEKGITLVACGDQELKLKIKNEKSKIQIKKKKIKEKEETSKTNKVTIAYEVGKLIAQKALEKKIEKVTFDRAGYKYHGRVKALAEGAREGGLKF